MKKIITRAYLTDAMNAWNDAIRPNGLSKAAWISEADFPLLEAALSDVLAKYGVAPSGISEREVCAREQEAFLRGWDVHLELAKRDMVNRAGNYRERLAAVHYPLPSSPPAPVLTDDEILGMTGASGWTNVREFGRAVERAVLTKLAQQEPPTP